MVALASCLSLPIESNKSSRASGFKLRGAITIVSSLSSGDKCRSSCNRVRELVRMSCTSFVVLFISLLMARSSSFERLQQPFATSSRLRSNSSLSCGLTLIKTSSPCGWEESSSCKNCCLVEYVSFDDWKGGESD